MSSSKYPSRGILVAIKAFRHKGVLKSFKLWKAKDGKLKSIELWAGVRGIFIQWRGGMSWNFLSLKTSPYNVTIIDDFPSNYIYTNTVA